VRSCFGSLFTARAISYRHDKGFDHTDKIERLLKENLPHTQSDLPAEEKEEEEGEDSTDSEE